MELQRKNRYGIGTRHVVFRKKNIGLHETRRHERMRGRFCELGHHRSQRRPCGRGMRRPFAALFPERAGLQVLC